MFTQILIALGLVIGVLAVVGTLMIIDGILWGRKTRANGEALNTVIKNQRKNFGARSNYDDVKK